MPNALIFSLLDQSLQQIEMQGVGPVGLRLFRRVVNFYKERIGAGRDTGASQRFDELGLTPTCTFLCAGKLQAVRDVGLRLFRTTG